MARYWVSLGEESSDEDKREKGFLKELESLSNHVSEDGFERYSYITEDLDEAKEVVRKAVNACKKHGFDDLAEGITITSQPQCPKCAHLGRFSDEYCSKCGAELTPAQGIDVEK